MNKILVSEIFHSIQGEGPNVGKLAVFLRLFGCNLDCTWCDSTYASRALNSKSEIQNSKLMSIDQILKAIRQFPCKHLVITGGEPLLQQKGLIPLVKALKGWYIEIETNGTIPIKISKFLEQINCSPKLSNSKNTPYPLKIRPTNRKVIYKFVAQEKRDLKEIRQYILDNKIPGHKVYIMPEGVNKKIVQERSKWIIEICKKEGYNFSPRLHIMLYGNKRGV